MKQVLLAAAVLSLALIACDDKKSSGAARSGATADAIKASCNSPKLGVCTDYTEAAFVLGEELVKTACTETKGSWSPAKCVGEKRLGSCNMEGSIRHYYPGGDFDYSAASAKTDCTDLFSGKWVASAK